VKKATPSNTPPSVNKKSNNHNKPNRVLKLFGFNIINNIIIEEAFFFEFQKKSPVNFEAKN
jgi:hypothetical protein